MKKDSSETIKQYCAHHRIFEWTGGWQTVCAWHQYADLSRALTKRKILQRYRGSLLGMLWSVMTPLVLLLIYTGVFTCIFDMTWDSDQSGYGIFAIMMYCGLIPFNFFTEMMSESTMLIIDNPNYVRRISFPIDILPVVSLGNSLFHSLIGLIILLGAILFTAGSIPWTVLLLPVIWLPFIVATLAFSFLLAAVGAFIRDIQHVINLVTAALFFVTPIFYPASKVPGMLQWILFVNPVAYAASNTRKIFVYGLVPEWTSWVLMMAVSLAMFWLVTGWFQVIRRRFSDVI